MKMLFILAPSKSEGLRFQYSHHPIVTATLAGVARKKGAQIAVIDAGITGQSDDDILLRCQQLAPDWIGIVPFEYRREEPIGHSFRLSRLLKEKLDVPIGFLNCPQDHLDIRRAVEKRELDFVVFGDSEEVVSIFAEKQVLDGKGLLWNSSQGLQENEMMKKLDWSLLATPAWDIFDWKRYQPSAFRYDREPVLPSYTSRSCPFFCDFCPESLFHTSDVYSHRPIDDIIAEIYEYQEKYNVQYIEFYDPTFGVDKDKLLLLLERLQQLETPISWSCLGRVDLLNRNILQKMKEAGCHTILFGVESAQREILERTNKSITHQQVEDIVGYCKELGIITVCSFILGLPLETKESMRKTIRYALTLNPSYAMFHPARLFGENKEWEELGTVSKNWDQYSSSINGYSYVPNGLTQADIYRHLIFAYSLFYGNPRKIASFVRDIRGKDDIVRYQKGLLQLGRFCTGLLQ